IGVATVTRDEILRDILQTGAAPHGAAAGKVITLETLRFDLDQRRRLDQKITFTNGCFDVLHAGHVQYLQEARAQGDVLAVGLNSDSSVRALKGKTRPVQQLADRSLILSSLQAVDFVTVFDESTPMHLIQAIRPDVLV